MELPDHWRENCVFECKFNGLRLSSEHRSDQDHIVECFVDTVIVLFRDTLWYITMEKYHFPVEYPLCLWLCSIAMEQITRGLSPFSMGKLTISISMFNGKLLVIPRGHLFSPCRCHPYRSLHVAKTSSGWSPQCSPKSSA